MAYTSINNGLRLYLYQISYIETNQYLYLQHEKLQSQSAKEWSELAKKTIFPL